MDFATVDSVYENLFSAQNFFAIHEQQQLDKQNYIDMANTAVVDLDMYRFEDGGGDARGSLLLGDDYCAGFNDPTDAGGVTDGAGATTTPTSTTTSTSSTPNSTTTNVNQNGTATEKPATSMLQYQQQQQGRHHHQQQQLLQQQQQQAKDINNKSMIGFELLTMFGNQQRNDCPWSTQFRLPRPAPTLQIGEEKFVLRVDTIFVLGMRRNVTKNDIIVFFGKMGQIKMDEQTMKPKIFVYKNKLTGRSKGEATITYTSPYAAQAAIHYLNGTKFMGQILSVVPAYLSTRPGRSVRFSYAQEPGVEQRSRQRLTKWKPAIDNWVCELCKNSNFVWRLSCNRCRVSKADAVSLTNNHNGSYNNINHSTSHPNLGEGAWHPRKDDWTCGYCFNVNFWYRQKCNRCRAPKTEINASSKSMDKWELVDSQTSVL